MNDETRARIRRIRKRWIPKETGITTVSLVDIEWLCDQLEASFTVGTFADGVEAAGRVLEVSYADAGAPETELGGLALVRYQAAIRALASPEPPAMEPRYPCCPQCGGAVSRVTYNRDSMLNADQFDAVRAGDWYCEKCPSNKRGNTNLCYWWDKEVHGKIAPAGVAQPPITVNPKSYHSVIYTDGGYTISYKTEPAPLDAPASVPDETNYPCSNCGKPRIKDEGGTVFTVCDRCWEATSAAPPAASVGEQSARTERTAQLIAHRVCCGVEHDPANGKIHGWCVVCGVPWPCEYAGKPPKVEAALPRAAAHGDAK